MLDGDERRWKESSKIFRKIVRFIRVPQNFHGRGEVRIQNERLPHRGHDITFGLKREVVRMADRFNMRENEEK